MTLVEGKVLNGAGSGLFLWTDEALVYAGLQHFDVLSASLGGYIPKCGATKSKPNGCDHPDYILLQPGDTVRALERRSPGRGHGEERNDLSDGSVFRNTTEAPGEIAGWVTVSATGYNDGKAFYSNYGTSNRRLGAGWLDA